MKIAPSCITDQIWDFEMMQFKFFVLKISIYCKEGSWQLIADNLIK